MTLDKQALDRYITGNYGEDQFDDSNPELEKELERIGMKMDAGEELTEEESQLLDSLK